MSLSKRWFGFFYGTAEIKYFHWFRWLSAGALLFYYSFVFTSPAFYLSHPRLASLSPTSEFAILLLPWLLLLGSLVAVFVGFKVRWSSLIVFLLFSMGSHETVFPRSSWMGIATAVFFLLFFIPVVDRFSVDHRLFKIPVTIKTLSLPVRLLEFCVALLYVNAMTLRFDDPSWRSGEVVQMLLSSVAYSRFAFVTWTPYSEFFKFLAYLTSFLEWAALALPILGRFRIWLILPLIGLHSVINLTGYFGAWHWVMVSLLILILGNSFSFETESWVSRHKISLSLISGLLLALTLSHFLTHSSFIFQPLKSLSIFASRWLPSGNIMKYQFMASAPVRVRCFNVYKLAANETPKPIQKLESTPLDYCLKGQFEVLRDTSYQSFLRSEFFVSQIQFENKIKDLPFEQEKEASRLSAMLGHALCRKYDLTSGEVLSTALQGSFSTGHFRGVVRAHYDCGLKKSVLKLSPLSQANPAYSEALNLQQQEAEAFLSQEGS